MNKQEKEPTFETEEMRIAWMAWHWWSNVDYAPPIEDAEAISNYIAEHPNEFRGYVPQ